MLPFLLDLPNRDEARTAAHRELIHRQYAEAQPSLTVRFIRWLLNEIASALGTASTAAPGGVWGLLVLTALAVLVVAVILTKLRPARSSKSPGLFDLAQELSAAEHRALAERAAAQGKYAEAIRERLRAVVRELEHRGILDPRPGRTADEVAREAGAVVPALAVALAEGAQVFDDVWYGGQEADADSYWVLVALDGKVSEARLALT